MRCALEAALWNWRKVMKSDAEGTILARLTLVMIRDAGCVPVAVMTDRRFQFFRLHVGELQRLGEVGGHSRRSACLMPRSHQATEKKKKGTQYAHCRPAAKSATKASTGPACVLYTSSPRLSKAHSVPPWGHG